MAQNDLVNTMMMEMERNNSQGDMNYRPEMMMQPGQQIGMGEVQYMPNGGQPNMMHNQAQMAAQMAAAQAAQMNAPPPESPEMPDMEEPDLSKYGMEDEGHGGIMDNLFDEVKGPLIVVALAFVMSLPQVNTILRNAVGKVTVNPLYGNIIMSLMAGVLFYVIMKFLVNN